MNRSLTRRLGTVAVALVSSLGLVATAGPAQAASMSFKGSGRQANLDQLEIGTLPAVQGNTSSPSRAAATAGTKRSPSARRWPSVPSTAATSPS